MQHKLDAVNKEIESLSRALSQAPNDSPSVRLLCTSLGTSHAQRFDLLEESDDIRKMIEYTTIVLTLTPDDDPGVPGLLNTLGTAHNKRYERLGGLDDIEKSIEYHSMALAKLPDGHSDLPRELADLAVSHNNRFGRLGELEDVRRAIEYQSRALALTPDGHPKLSARLANLGAFHSYRFTRLGNLDDLEKAIEHQSRAIALTPDGNSGLSASLANLGAFHCYRFVRLGKLGDLEKAIEYTSRALALTPDGHPYLAGHLANLGVYHKNRFELLGELADLEKAMEYQSRALALTPEGHPNLPTGLANLGLSLRNRFQRLGELADLKKAIECQSRALALTPNGHPLISAHLTDLGVSHSDLFKRLGDLGDLEKAIEYDSRALALTPDDHPDLSTRLANLGASHSDRFMRLGKLSDLEKVIEYEARALDLTPDGHPHLSACLANLGVSYSNQFGRLGKLADLEKSIEYQSRALALTSDGNSNLPMLLANLGAFHSYRFMRLDDLDDLEKAIEHTSRALALTPDGHLDLSDRLANLGSLHSYRFTRLDELADLAKALEYKSRALDLTPDGHPHLSARLVNLGVSHSNGFQRLGKLADLDKAIEYQCRALKLTATDHPDSCLIHFKLALNHMYYYEFSSDPIHRRDSLHSFRIASQSPVGAPRDRFQHARAWAAWASRHNAMDCIEAYQTTIDLLPQVVWLGATTAQRYEDLELAATLATDAATAAIAAVDYSLALEWLEHARCVVWNQNLMLRSPLDQLEASYPSLSTSLRAVAHQLHSASSESKESRVVFTGSLAPEQVSQHHRRLAKEYNDLLTQARTLPGFEDFLRPMKVAGLVRAARHGPIVVVNCHKERCDALLILPGQTDIKHIPLPNFNSDKAQHAQAELKYSLQSMGLSQRGGQRRPMAEEDEQPEFGSVLAVLWNDVVKPILDALGLTNCIPPGNLPHITWCPTGAMSFLPLHAAGYYDQPLSRVFDYVVSSYTPTLTALLESTPYLLSPDTRVLAVGQATTSGHSPLPGTAMELKHVKAHIHGKAKYSQLMDNQATITSVLDSMEQHDWVHLACHAHQNVGDATRSGFFLHDGVLDLASINRRSFKRKGLAFLSACQTATGDEKLPDEAVHLASGMLIAGYTSVIATMWSVVDSDAPQVADKVYSQLMEEGKLGNGEAGKALHSAMAGLRERIGVENFSRWVPYIHIGS
ncbi:hypothetical protein ACGC1H_003968 [Rhizoctonia solani]|uniref:CHAT domain-containing protein n=1 Tax=Rhizoctonia solani TaxID=456999 RepID=A0A8H3GFL9_9AGAM|nr:unnamed protein product [Rhizoctonia solani]